MRRGGETPHESRGAIHTVASDDLMRLVSGGVRGSGVDAVEAGEDLSIAAMRANLRNVVDRQEA